MADQVDHIAGRTQAYYYVDGLPEIAVGLLLLAAGGILQLWRDFQEGGWLGGLLAAGAIILLVGGGYATRQLVQSAKERVTYPRTGYATLRKEADPNAQRLWLVALFAVAILALLFPRADELPLGIGVFFGAMLVYLGYRGQVRRFYLLAGGAVIVGIVAALWLDETAGTAAFFVGMGILLFVSGAIVFLRYLRRHAGPGEDAT